MKKLVIATALAALTATSALAQNVTVYGIVDAAVRQDTKSNSSGDSKNAMVSGAQSTSRLGFKGVEDLGGGLSAKFVLETGFSPTSGGQSQTGSTGSVMFDRFAYVALADKKAGEIQLGRNTTATYDLAAQGITDPLNLWMDGVSTPVTASNGTYNVASLRINQAVNAVSSTNGYKNTRADSMIKYVNTFGPVGVIAGYAPGGVTGNDSQKSSYTYAASFKQGAFAAGAGQYKATDGADKSATTTSYGASYKLGDATLTLAQHRNKTDAGYVAANLTTTKPYEGPVLGTALNSGPSTDARINIAGVKYQFTPAFVTTVAYNDGTYKNGAGKEGTLKSYVVFNEYYLSKRTNLYGVVDYTKADGDLTAASVSSNSTGVMAGVRHQF